ncbi:peptide chain release factor N(5)-glutamine methyltransferase [Leptobacterium flavescens]|uniref:peptide chain release factor N(5)-glutamine methyltransferase n=1 Tax=Leptobacterium flavescens TaxID=472055 RepID=UPI0019540F16|nr:peptide chain release factor N(5)-glutamine methyltransferase [Leptobacterium flavescens]
MRLKEIQQLFHKELDALFGPEETDQFFYLLLEEYCGLKAFTLALSPEHTADKETEQKFFEALSRLKTEQPIQQILGKTLFCDLEFKINKHVLIPRPETEELVKWIENEVKDRSNDNPLKILDIGTGSGCIAISLAKLLEKAEVHAMDVSADALELARENASHNKAEVTFIEADILKLEALPEKYDIIVSNPPYVRRSEEKQMKANVLKYEPHLALFVEDEDPLLFYRRITAMAVDNLMPGGCIFFEINQYLSSSMNKLLNEYGFTEIELRKDIFENDRMIRAVKAN